jgi:hypothetical protein
MHKYAAATSLAIALTITMLTPAFSAVHNVPVLHEEECDGWRPDWGRTWAIACHCSFECRRQYSYTVRWPCSPGMQGYVSGTKGLCEGLVPGPLDTVRACEKTCVKAKGASRR